MTRNPVITDRAASLDDALALLECYGFRHLPVVECNRVLGMLSDRDLRFATGLLASEQRLYGAHGQALPGPARVEDIMRHPVHCLRADDSAIQAARDMLRLGIGAIPVVELVGQEELLTGIVSESDLLRAFLELCRSSPDCDAPARTRMHAPMPRVAPETLLAEALQVLDRRLLHLGILRANELLGLVSERDLLVGLARATIHEARARSGADAKGGPRCVADVMATRLVTAEPGTPLAHCAGRMLDHKISALPILEGEHALGLLTQRDILEHFASVAAPSTGP